MRRDSRTTTTWTTQGVGDQQIDRNNPGNALDVHRGFPYANLASCRPEICANERHLEQGLWREVPWVDCEVGVSGKRCYSEISLSGVNVDRLRTYQDKSIQVCAQCTYGIEQHSTCCNV